MENTQVSCPCKRLKCKRHGDCEACRKFHHAYERKPLTTCERLEAEIPDRKERRANRRSEKE